MKTIKFTNEIKKVVLINTWKLFKAQDVRTMECFNEIWAKCRNEAKKGNFEIDNFEVKSIEQTEIELKEVANKELNKKMDKIIKDNYSYVCNVIKKYTYNNTNDLDLIASNVFLRVKEIYNTIKTDKNIQPFLYSITKNKVIDFYRSEKNHTYTTKISDYTDEKGNEYFTLISDSKSNDIENQEITDRLNKSMSKLSPIAQQVVKLRFFDDLQCNEIAEQLNLKLSTVLQHIHRSKDVLRNDLAYDYELIKQDYLTE
jgi:RNA polymerase sigma factor (sigma-70 family)